MLGFLNRLFNGEARAPGYPPVDVERPVYAIGDVHGRADLLLPLIEKILQQASALDAPPEVVFIGDYIDRGDQSFEVVELLTTVAEWPEIEPVFLLGNHEEMLLDFLEDPELGPRWLRNGGLQTMMSYGVTEFTSLQEPGELARLRDQMQKRLGPHLAFLEGLSLSHRNGNVWFTHAGADPRRGLANQSRDALLWGSPAFATTLREDGMWVCHGHVIVDRPTARHGRIAIDTGAFYTGRLTAVRLGVGPPEFLEATDESDGASAGAN